MRLPESVHASRPWRIQALLPDFAVEDVWALPMRGGPDDLSRLVQLMVTTDPADGSRAVRTLFALRWKIGGLLGWDEWPAGATLRDRVPADLRENPGPDHITLPFSSLYQTGDEWAAEIANKTMHGVLHLGWVPDGDGRHRGEMTVYVKRNGRFGAAYMAAIRPFRHRVVYPRMIRDLERRWGQTRAE